MIAVVTLLWSNHEYVFKTGHGPHYDLFFLWFEDGTSAGELKSSRHVIFDEAHYCVDKIPPYTKQLIELVDGHLSNPTTPDPDHTLPLHLVPTDDAVTYTSK